MLNRREVPIFTFSNFWNVLKTFVIEKLEAKKAVDTGAKSPSEPSNEKTFFNLICNWVFKLQKKQNKAD